MEAREGVEEIGDKGTGSSSGECSDGALCSSVLELMLNEPLALVVSLALGEREFVNRLNEAAWLSIANMQNAARNAFNERP